MGKGLLLSLILCSTIAHAEESSVSVPAQPAPTYDAGSMSSEGSSESKLIDAIKQKKYEEDERINDLQIRADAGSLSRYSMKFVLGYTGPEVNNLASPSIPNPQNRTTDIRSNVSGSVGVKYRLTSNDGLYFSAGLKEYVRAQSGDNQDLTNPSVSYDHTYLFAKGVQGHTTVIGTYVTNSFYRPKGEVAGATLSQMVKWNIADTRWVVGGQVEVANYFYSRGYVRSDDGKVQSLTDYYLNMIPSVEYKLTDNLNLNTSFLKQISHFRSQTNPSTFDSAAYWNARLGVGWAIQHDIYINPYITFYPEAMSWQFASLGLSGIINIF